jgi:hypothetical protein
MTVSTPVLEKAILTFAEEMSYPYRHASLEPLWTVVETSICRGGL